MPINEMKQTSTFQKILEAVEALPLEDQQILLDILQKRIQQKRRHQLVKEIIEIRQDYAEKKVKFGSVEEFLAELDD